MANRGGSGHSTTGANQTYNEGEKVLCYHGNLAYEAKVIAIRDDTEEHRNYRIHYQGWNKNWDDWVTTNRLLKYNAQNLELKRKLELEAKKARPESHHRSRSSGGSSSSRRRSEARQRDSHANSSASVAASALDDAILSNSNSMTSAPATPQSSTTVPLEQQQRNVSSSAIRENHHSHHHSHSRSERSERERERGERGDRERSERGEREKGEREKGERDQPPELVALRPEAKIKIPEDLRSWLLDDNAAIKSKKLPVLPSTNTIASIFEDYQQYKRNSKITVAEREVVGQMMSGLSDYFNVLLGSHLLYKFERAQYQQLLETHTNTQSSTQISDATMETQSSTNTQSKRSRVSLSTSSTAAIGGDDANHTAPSITNFSKSSTNTDYVDLTRYYGVVHLMRLIQKLPFMLSLANLDEKCLASIVSHVQDLLRWLAKSDYFHPDEYYQVAPPEYLK